ncbi:phosphoribosylanthranilate isomerase [Novosphingobium sp. RL4]|uniref:phosphoribosylanthranilate isomerase n=1 Tax=Novosphingobium sp. RL4 TaxID=3109595 RepID=UPI002D794991|nr:phosphoribosylanthranilate isomerase [Novosphingobium sp. RL4]WRT94183.1 phosphoribosylanthranilate isomerase [Novosphingobium sp. RL4]
MPTAAIKICGISTPEALEAAIRARAAHAGFVFFPRSPRNVTPAQAALLSQQAGSRIGKVGLFVDADDAAIAEAVAGARLDALQLHGSESPERAAALRDRFGIAVWKALSVATAEDAARAAAYAGAVDLVLFDAKTPKGSLPGGMGLSFDWSLVADWKGPVPWGLAGGLTPDNVAQAIRMTRTPLVDTSSGVESAPGVKDLDRIDAFARAVRGA